jgi:hypothetical protein
MEHASKALVERRVTEIHGIVMDGAKAHDVRAFVRGMESVPTSAWFVGPDATPLADDTIRGYITRVNEVIDEEHARRRKPQFRKRVAQLDSVFARAIAGNELSVARACLMNLFVVERLIPDHNALLLKKLSSVEAKLEAAEHARDGKKD